MDAINLGTHIVEVADDETIILADDHVAIELDRDEAYRLLLTLQELFK